MSSSVRTISWLLAYATLVLAPVAVLLLVPVLRATGFWLELSIGLGYAGLTMMAMQFLLTARFRTATAPFGIDIIYYFHRYLAYVLLAVVAAHPIVLVARNPAIGAYLNPIGAPREVATGTISLIMLLLLVLTSALRKPLGIRYERWRMVHLAFAVLAVGLALSHALSIGRYAAFPVVRALWIAIAATLVLVVLRVRVLRPWRLLRSGYRVMEVRPGAGSTWSLVVDPENHDGFDFEPGQFAWVTLRASPFAMREHPFSIASPPLPGGRLEFAIKELGDFTRTLGGIRAGERCYVDGPYGAFSVDRHPHASGYVFIAGGIGIAPMMSMLRALAARGDGRTHVLLSAHSRWDRVPLLDELQAVSRRIDLRTVHVLESPPEDWEGERGTITSELLERHLPPERAHLEYFVCGPVPMIRTVEAALRRLGVPRSRVHTELFDLA